MRKNIIAKLFILVVMLVCLTSCNQKEIATFSIKNEFRSSSKTVALSANVEDHEHNWVTFTTEKEATCTEKGVVIEKCTECGAKKEIILNMIPHTFDEGKVEKNPTCMEEGLLVRECLVCHEKEEFILNMAAHSFDEGQIVKEATCKEEGKIVFSCTVCSKSVEQIIPTLEHNVIKKEGKEPNCYNEGLTVGYECSLCGEVLVEQQVLEALGHAWGEPKIVTKATCTNEGVEKVTCSLCSASKNTTTPKLDHVLQFDYYNPATCINNGSMGKGYCQICKTLVEPNVEILALGHNFINGSCIRCHEEEPAEELEFKKVNGAYYLSKVSPEVRGILNIPLMYNNEYVVGILDGAFDNTGVIHIVNLTEMITDIQVGAFDECKYLFDIVIDAQNPVYYVQNSCLIERATKNLLVGSAGGKIPHGIVSIENGAFKNRVGLVTIEIPSTVEKIGKDSLVGCENLMTIIVDPENKVYYSQDECLLLRENNLLLLGCQESIISEGVEVIGTGAFANCSSLTEIKLPSSVTTIMPGAFTNCQLVASLYISENVTELAGAFEGMISLTKITVSEKNPKYTVLDGCLIEKKTKKLVLADNRGIIPEGIEIIGTGAFAGNEGLVVLELPESVKEIEARAFANCTNLETIIFNTTLTSLPEECFIGCEYLENVKIPKTITSVGARAFKGCIRLERFEVSDTMQYVGEAAFDDCNRIHFVCEAKKQPAKWDINWNPDGRPVLWGHYIVD